MTQFPEVERLFVGELVGECLMPRLDVQTFLNDDAYRARTIRLVRDHTAGGFCVFADLPESVLEAVSVLQSVALKEREGTALHGIPLLFSCDCEFGLRMRLKRGGTEFPDAMAMAKAGDPELVRQVGQAIAQEMRTLGLTWNFAPVADVNSNPKNPIINTRSFGDNPETVIRYSVPFLEGLQSEGVAGCAKHFPGHGDTAVDSHHELPFIEGGGSQFHTQELPPFEALIRAGVASVMTGHLACPDFAEELGAPLVDRALPATLSPTLTTGLLRQQLGFVGVVVTDAMEMHAITKLFGEEEASIRALEAGADVLLMPVDSEVAYHALLGAVEAGRLNVSQLREKVTRIWKMRRATEAVCRTDPPDETALALLERFEKEHKHLSQTIASEAIRLRGEIRLEGASLIIIADDRPQAREKAQFFARKVSVLFETVTSLTPKQWESSPPVIDEHTVIATFHRARGYLGEAATDWTLPRIMASIAHRSEADSGHGIRAGRAVPRGLILIGSPYLDRDFEQTPDFVLKTFSESMPSVDAALERLSGIMHAE